MRLPRLALCLAVLAGIWLVSDTALPAATEDPLDSALVAIGDVTRTDDQRAAARVTIANLITGGNVAAFERLVKLGSAATDDNVRIHVAIVLGQTRGGKTIIPPASAPAAVELLSKWLSAEKGDAALRLWAAVALANTQSPQVLPLLKEKAMAAGSDLALRVSVMRALAAWRGPALNDLIVPLLLEAAQDKSPDIRISACDTLRMTELDEERVVMPLLKIAREDPKEEVWRAAVAALRRLSGGLNIPPDADDQARQKTLQAWENIWRIKKKARERTPK